MRSVLPHILAMVAAVTLFAMAEAGRADDAEQAAPQVDFGRDIRPILSDTCFTCHGPDAGARDSQLRLDTKDGAMADLGGYRAIVPGDAKNSELIRRVASDDADLRMPPADSGRPLTKQQIDLLRRWIDEGAPWQEHWSFIPPQPTALPSTKKHNPWCRSPIDRFVAARLEKEGLAPSPEASKETLIRRATLDLTGLPPTLAEVDAFLVDDSPDACERLVDRLLNSPRYGEHMASTWLDAARYSDTNGYQQDRTRTMWPWRDWVIDALNANMPFDQFTVEQIAGDLLPRLAQGEHENFPPFAQGEQENIPPLAKGGLGGVAPETVRLRRLLASGFNRNHPLNGEGGRIPEESRVEYVVDRVETTATIWLGLTAGCARCHDHKYDPLSQQEFYNLYAFFNSIEESGAVDAGGNAKPVMKIPSREQAQQHEQLASAIAAIEGQLHGPPDETKFAAWQKKLREEMTGESRESAWMPVELVKFTSDNGQEMELWDDGSIYVGGKNPDSDSYTVVLKTDAENIRGLRLEALAHESFTKGGIARSNSGNFVLTEMEISTQADESDQTQPIKIASAEADFEQGGFPVTSAFDGNPKSGWAVNNPSNMRIDRAAKFLFSEPLSGGEGTKLTLRLRHESGHLHHNLGRFRLSITTQENPPLKEKAEEFPAAIVKAISTLETERSEAQQRQLADHYRRTAPEFKSLRGKLVQAQKQFDELRKSFPEVMVMAERSSPRETFVLKVGQYDQPDRKRPAAPNIPAVLPPLPEQTKPNRLALANWLVDPANPLTARVTVNRIWQHHFGVGLVKTSEDFGLQGERPSHPALLDWLALEFVRSGWDVKHLHKLIVTSSTYRQSSSQVGRISNPSESPDLSGRISNPSYLADPQNRLLARGPRFRLSSFAIRDQALALSGLLVEKTGGEPVKPYQPPGVWDDFSLGKIKYQRDRGEKLYRRSVYTFWRRSVSPTTLFDTATRLVCDVRPRRTNTPLHALTTLNDEAYVEASRRFAQRIMTEGGASPEERVTWAFRLATSRRPSESETKVLLRSLDRAKTRFDDDPNAAKKLLSVGETQHNEKLPPAELAAYTSVANMLLNLDEVLTRE